MWQHFSAVAEDVEKTKVEQEDTFSELFADLSEHSKFVQRIHEDKDLVFPNFSSISTDFRKCYSCRINPHYGFDTCGNFSSSDNDNTCITSSDFCVSYHYQVRFLNDNRTETWHWFERGNGGLGGCSRHNLCNNGDGCFKKMLDSNATSDMRQWRVDTVHTCCCRGDL